MLQSMNVFHHQTTRPKFLHFPSSCHGRRIPHKPPVLVSFPAKTEFNLKFLHSASKSVLVSSPAIKKFRPILFALPRDNEEFSSDNEEEEEEEEPINQEHGGALILSDNEEYVVREAELEKEFRASASLKAEGLYEYRSHNPFVSSYIKNDRADMEFDVIMKRYAMHYLEPFMCIIAVRKEGENMLQRVIGTLDLRVKHLLEGETYPEELVKLGNLYSKFKKRGSEKCGIITNVTVAESARQQGVGSSMLKFAIEDAKEKGAKKIFLQVVRDNEPALELYRKMGFEVLAEVTPQLEEQNMYLYMTLDGRVSYMQMRNLCRKVVYFKWERPVVDCMKMNTDASVKKVENTFGVKGAIIFRDSSAKLVRGFYVIFDGSSFKNFDSTLAEIMTVKRGLEKAIELGFTWVWCETDNSNVVTMLKQRMTSEIEEIGTASKTEQIAKAIWRLVEEYSIKFEITHIWSEGNGPAHCLVSRSFVHDFDFADPREISTTFVKKLEDDESGMERMRVIKGAGNKRKMKK